MDNKYLIPANSKKGRLFLGLFRGVDVTILAVGVTISLILLVLIKSNNIGVLLGLASPALIAIFLVLPIPYYHNVMTLIGNFWNYYSGRKKYYWRGWCIDHGRGGEAKYISNIE